MSLLAAVTGCVLIADQLVKVFVTKSLPPGRSLHVGRWLRIRRVDNRSAIRPTRFNRVVLTAIWAIVATSVAIALASGLYFQHTASQVGLGAALGGAASNLLDCWNRGAILDFIDLGWWPVFNVADASITLGALFAIWFV